MLQRRKADTRNMTGLSPSPVSIRALRHTSVSHWWDRALRWLVDARSHRVVCLIAGVWLINAFDLVFTVLSHQQGMLVEQNPVARQMLTYGVPSLVLYKIGLVFIGSYPLLKFRAARISEWGALIVLIVYAALAVRWSDCYHAYSAAFQNAPHYIEAATVGQSLIN